jgi:hypothetical protein
MPSESAFIRDTGRVDINNAYMTMHVNHPHAHLDEEKHCKVFSARYRSQS